MPHFTCHIDKHWKKKNYWKLILDTYTDIHYKIICIAKRKEIKEEKRGGGEAGQVADRVQQVRACSRNRSYAVIKKNYQNYSCQHGKCSKNNRKKPIGGKFHMIWFI